MHIFDVGGQVSFLLKAFVTTCMGTGEHGRRGRVDGVDVFAEVTFLGEAFVATFIWTWEGRRGA